jgi:hypothetical protein
MTRALLALAVLCAGGACGGGSDDDGEAPSETCSRVAEVICQKFFECYTAEEREAAMLPASEEECLDEIEGDLECATQTVDNQCDEGETYDPDRAQDCLGDYEVLSCEVVRDGIEDSDTPSCAQVCQ